MENKLFISFAAGAVTIAIPHAIRKGSNAGRINLTPTYPIAHIPTIQITRCDINATLLLKLFSILFPPPLDIGEKFAYNNFIP